MDALFHDLKHATRLLARRPGWTAAAVLTLALGIGATTAIYSLFDGVLLRPLPYPASDRLVRLHQVDVATGEGLEVATFAWYEAWRERQDVLDPFGAYASHTLTLNQATGSERVPGAFVSAKTLDALGVAPVIGRGFVPADDEAGAEPVVLVAHATWRDRFGGDPDVVGTAVVLNERPHTVVGVLPAGFRFPAPATEFWLAMSGAPRDAGTAYLSMLGRVPDGLSFEAARAGLARSTRAQTGADGETETVRLAMTPLRDVVVGDVAPLLLVFLGAVGVLLLIATLNVANLVLVRAAERGRELDVRAALGAGRGRLARLHLVEGVVLAVVSAALGLTLAVWLVEAFARLGPDVLPRATELAIHPGVLTFAAALTGAVGVGVGLAPSLRRRPMDLSARLRAGGGAMVGGGSGRGLRSGLVVAQVALATVLLAVGGLLVRSLAELWSTDSGFRTERVAAIGAVLPSGYEDVPRIRAFYSALMERLEATPELEAAAVASFFPFSVGRSMYDLEIEGRPAPGPGVPGASTELLVVSPSYFETLGIVAVTGRTLGRGDDEGASPVAVITASLARLHFPDGDPVGRRIRLEDESWRTVVGVVADTRQHGLHAPAPATTYLPYAQAGDKWPFGMAVMVRTADGLGPAAAAARAAIAGLDPDVAVSSIRWLDDRRADGMASDRLRAWVVGAFALLALILAAVGVYAVMAYAATLRRREVGLRIALGATRTRIVAGMVRDAARLVALGLGIGLVGALATGRALGGFLVGIGPRDPATLAAITLLLGGAALVAAFLPARRASRMEPVRALRDD